jgi:hypothetical protein
MLSPAEALRHKRTLIKGAADVATEPQQRLLLECIRELAREGLEHPPIVQLGEDASGVQH